MDTILKRNVRIYHATQFLEYLEFTLPIYILFGKNYLGISYTQIAILTSILFVTSIAFDFLLGIFADSYSRKKAYSIGIFLSFLSLLPYIFTKDYTLLVVAAFLAGIGSALVSNVLNTFIHDQLKENDLLDQYAGITSKAQQMLFLGRTVAGILGGLFFMISPILPYIAYAITDLICLLLAAMFLKEKSIVKAKAHFSVTTKKAVSFLKQRKDILYFCFVGLVILIFGDLLFGYYQPYFNTLHISPWVLGFIYAGLSLASAYGSYLMKGFLPKYSPQFINTLMILGMLLTTLLMIPQIPLLAFIAPIFVGITFGFVNPNLRHYLNSQSPSEIKTSVASFGNTFYAVGSMLGLLLSGFLADHFPPLIVLGVVILGSICALLLNNFSKVKNV